MKIASISDYREAARRRLPKFLFEYIDGGSYAEQTLGRNIADLRDLALRQRVLCDVSAIDTTCEFYGTPHRLPVALGPVGLSGMYARRGEVQAARAAETFGVPFCLSTVSVCSLEEIDAARCAPFWFQLYVIRDKIFMRDLLERAREVGCSALIFTVDMPMPGARYRDVRSGLAQAPGLRGAARRALQATTRPYWAWNVGLRGHPHHLGNIAAALAGKSGLEDFMTWMVDNFDPTVTWKDLEHIRAIWDGPLIIKGIMDAEDALQAARLGADGIIVSNHGGRQLDGVPSTLSALPAIANAVGDALTVSVDGGVRSGLDVLRMMAMGAKNVYLGRAWAYALAARGEAGVTHMLELLEAELRIAMALTGVTKLSDIDPCILVSQD